MSIHIHYKMWSEITYPTLHSGCNYLFILELTLIHVSKRGHRWQAPCPFTCARRCCPRPCITQLTHCPGVTVTSISCVTVVRHHFPINIYELARRQTAMGRDARLDTRLLWKSRFHTVDSFRSNILKEITHRTTKRSSWQPQKLWRPC